MISRCKHSYSVLSGRALGGKGKEIKTRPFALSALTLVLWLCSDMTYAANTQQADTSQTADTSPQSQSTDNATQKTDKTARRVNNTITVEASDTDAGPIDEGWKPNDNYTVRSARSAALLDLSPKHTPQNITSFTAQQIQDQGMLSLAEVMDYTPGMTVIRAGVGGAGNIPVYSRTFPVRSITMDGVIGSTFLLSGLPNGQLSMVDPFLYERIDIVRGATGLTSGSGDPSASLAFIRKHPYLQRHLTLSGKTGSYGLRRIELDFSTPIVDSWRSRFAMAAEGGNHWVDQVRHNNLALSWINDLDLTHSDMLSIGGTYYDFTVHGAGPHGVARFSEIWDRRPPDKRPPGSDDIMEQHFTDTAWGLRNFNNATLWSRTNRNYRNLFATYAHTFANDWEAKLSYNYADNADKVMYGEMGTVYFVADGRDSASYRTKYDDRRNKVHTLDVSLRGSFQLLGEKQDFIIGYDYFNTQETNYDNRFNRAGVDLETQRAESHLSAYWTWNPLCNDDDFLSRSKYMAKVCERYRTDRHGLSISQWRDGQRPAMGGKTRLGSASWHQVEQGGYFNTYWRLIPRTHLLLGGRLPLYQLKSRSYEGNMTHYYNSNNPYLKEYALHAGFLPYVGLIVDVTDDISAYYSYTMSYRPEPFEHLNPLTNKPMKSPTYVSNEVGVKGGFFGDRLNLSASYFDILQHHYPFVSLDNRTSTEGVDGYRAFGYELTVAGEITPDWLINAGYARQIQHYTSSTNANNQIFIFPEESTGKYASPERTFKLFTSYRATKQLTLGFGWRYQSLVAAFAGFDENKNLVKGTHQPAYSVFDAMARWQFNRHFSVQLNVNNLLDKIYYTHERSYVSGAPRNFMFTVAYKM